MPNKKVNLHNPKIPSAKQQSARTPRENENKNGIRKGRKAKGLRKCTAEPISGSRNDKIRTKSAIDRMLKKEACSIHKPPKSLLKRSKGRDDNQSARLGSGRTLYHKAKTVDDAIKRTKTMNDVWKSRIMEYADRLLAKMSAKDGQLLRALLGLRAYSGPIMASDIPATRRFGLICVDVVHSQWLAVRHLRWFHITLFSKDYNVTERGQPALALKQLKARAYKEIQELGLNGLLWIDVDPMPNYSDCGKGGTYMFHVHALCFTDQDFGIHEARMKLKRSRIWKSSLQATATSIKEITKKKGSACWWANYGAKPPYRAKRLVIRDDGSKRLRWTDQGYRPQIAMRLAEGLSQIALMDTFFAVGEGKFLRDDVRRRLGQWHRARWPDQRPVKLMNARSFFRRMWLLTRVTDYSRWRVIGSSI